MADSKSLEDVDEEMRSKYLEIVRSLNLEELKRFNKVWYKKLIKSDIMEVLPDADNKAVEDTAHYISNSLNNEAQHQKGIKRLQGKTSNTRRSSKHMTAENNVNQQAESNQKQSSTGKEKAHSMTKLNFRTQFYVL